MLSTLLALAAAGLTACGSSDSTGPLGNGGATGQICNAKYTGEPVTWGNQEVTNSGKMAAVIESVTLNDAAAMKLLAAYVVRVKNGTALYGERYGYPSATAVAGVSGIFWSSFRRAEGATVPPARGKDVVNVLLVLQAPGAIGTASGFTIRYREGSKQYQVRTHFAVKFVRGKC